VGLELGVMAVVSGRVGFRAESMNVSVELVNVNDGTVLWREAYDRPTSEILSLQADISRSISASLRPRLSTDEQHRAARPQTANTEAYKLCDPAPSTSSGRSKRIPHSQWPGRAWRILEICWEAMG
jgi:hypothetical protein